MITEDEMIRIAYFKVPSFCTEMLENIIKKKDFQLSDSDSIQGPPE
jgi:hypothetical protein